MVDVLNPKNCSIYKTLVWGEDNVHSIDTAREVQVDYSTVSFWVHKKNINKGLKMLSTAYALRHHVGL